ncbi:MAG TPA: tetratricopeptide repeat protein [Vicinamibacterales bacterium]|nr:tetratricopeptide repeat protein [Vicinamibacterales bacterium]
MTRLSALAVLLLLLPGDVAVHAEESPATMMAHGHWKRVRAIAQERIRAAPADAEANYLMARVYLQWDAVDAALPHAERAVKAAPQNAEYLWTLARVYGEQAGRAGVLKQVGLARRFRNAAETVLKMDPMHVEAHFGMMIFYLKAPGIVGGDKAKAAATAEAIGRIDRAKGFQAQARLAQEQQQREKLPDLFRRCIEANPREYECHTALVNAAASESPRNTAAAERHAREAIGLEPDRVSGYSGLVWSLIAQKRIPEAEAVLAEAEKMVPDDFAPYYTAASLLYNDNHDLPRAERYLRKYLSQEREAGRATHAVAQWRLGLVLERQGRRPEAIAALETAVRLDGALEQAKKDLKRLKS